MVATVHWQEVCEHQSLHDLPFKLELNAQGAIVMNAVKVKHALYQGEIEFLLRTLLKKGKTLPECAIKTTDGTKVADVAWASPERVAIITEETECSIAPEICVEVHSSSNTGKEMQTKRRLYFASGAVEVWFCNDGAMSFYHKSKKTKKSTLVPEFPLYVTLVAP